MHVRDTYVEREKEESSNDRNDRAIRSAAKWYSTHLQMTGVQVLLLTNDMDNKRLATNEGLLACTGGVCLVFNCAIT